MMIDPMMATVETARRYEVVWDGMQVTRLLARLVRNLRERNPRAARANRVELRAEAEQWTSGHLSREQIKEAAQ
jgi:hypothetical protein